jgi:hypothetical protein
MVGLQKMNMDQPHRLLRSISINLPGNFGAGNCIIIPENGQTATGPFTLEFDTGDKLTNVIPGDSFFFDHDKYESCVISSSNNADHQIQIQAGFGRKYALSTGGSAVTIGAVEGEFPSGAFAVLPLGNLDNGVEGNSNIVNTVMQEVSAPLSFLLTTPNENVMVWTSLQEGQRLQSGMIEVTVIGSGQTLTVSEKMNSNSIPVSLYDKNGTLLNTTGVISATGDYYFDLHASLYVNITSSATVGTGAEGYFSGSYFARPDKTCSASSFLQGQVLMSATPAVFVGNIPIVERRKLLIKALNTNTGICYIGYSSASCSSINGFLLAAGESISLEVNNPNLLWVAGSVTTDFLNWIVETT